MDVFIDELIAGLPDSAQLARVTFRLAMAALFGAVVGWQRERVGKAAGLRTHMLVSLGAALYVIAPIEYGMANDALSRIIQGLVTGIGFLGAGAILKLTDQRLVKGLTTAAGLWLTAAVGIAVGLGRWGTAAVSVVLIWFILDVLARLERRLEHPSSANGPGESDSGR
jgi:putative Mg2+ transporter-C (MgtC) family protein